MMLGRIQSIHESLQALLHKERKGLVEFLRQLFVFDREMGYAAYGCPSTFEYLVRVLHLAEGTAYRRLAAMKLVHRYPQVANAIEAGFVNATQLAMLAKVITDANVDALLRDATHLSKRKTEELVVSIRPKEVPAPGLRRLPAPVVRPVAVLEMVDAQTSAGEASPHAPKVTPPVERMGLPGGTSPDGLPLALAPAPAPVRPRARLEPFAAERWSWRLVLDLDRKERLDRLTGYLAHKFPDGDLGKIFDQMLADSLEKHGKRLGFITPAHPRPIPQQLPTPGRRQYIPRAVRRAVLERDGHRCTEICADGQRCRETEMLEMDHLNPAKETGSSTVDDLVTKCRAHNQYRALRTYGRPYVERRKEEGRREREARRASKLIESGPAADAIDLPLPLPLLVREPVAPWNATRPCAVAG